ncbi:MAG: TldD/PmbA family protein [Bacteroidales bacterium]|nr:TldD/PmbA family protein [Bacteroidales bacterium]
MRKICGFLLLVLMSVSFYAQDALLKILKDELKYEFNEMQKLQQKPYFMDFRVIDRTSHSITSDFGSIAGQYNTRVRNFVPSVRVGDTMLDNNVDPHQTSARRFGVNTVSLPLDDNAKAIQQTIWDECFFKYKRAVDDYEKASADKKLKVEAEDKAPSFSQANVEVYYEEPLKANQTKFDEAYWKERIKKVSAEFLKNPEIIVGTASVSYSYQRRYYVNTAGAEVVQNQSSARIMINAMIKADDGMELPLFKSYFAYTPDGLPSEKELLTEVKMMMDKLVKLKNAPLVSPYTGPALLSGAASGVFFHEIFGHRIEGQKMKSERDGQTFKKMVGELVLPGDLTVYCDPTLTKYIGKDLNGHYKYDDQGVKARRVNVVENGILKQFLMTRTSIDGFPQSNGHARADLGYDPDARQSNLIIESSKPKTDAELRKLLIDEAKAQDKEYGYFFKAVSGGLTMTGRAAANSFNVTPLEVYRVYVDGRPDEMVRGVDLIGTPLSMFSRIIYAGDGKSSEIFTGTCGAGSGSIPVTAISPTILVKQVEMQRKAKSNEKAPVLPRP